MKRSLSYRWELVGTVLCVIAKCLGGDGDSLRYKKVTLVVKMTICPSVMGFYLAHARDQLEI